MFPVMRDTSVARAAMVLVQRVLAIVRDTGKTLYDGKTVRGGVGAYSTGQREPLEALTHMSKCDINQKSKYIPNFWIFGTSIFIDIEKVRQSKS